MIRRIIPLALFALIVNFGLAQIPKTTTIGNSVGYSNFSLACPPGASPDGGTSTQTLFPSASSNDVLFLCLGDSMDVQHFGGDLSGDPQPASAPGFSYVFYDCPPTVTGQTAADILGDACHIEIVPGDITAIQNNIDIDGNATFFNEGQVQAVLNAGAPMTVWFAPITLDDFAAFAFEQDGSGVTGPCINVNTADAFSVTYLNEISASNININALGDCTASFTVAGGLPEFDGSDYTSVNITLNTDPSVVADIDGVNFTHNDVIQFTVPQAGVYDVEILDDKSCPATFTIDMSGCSQVTFDATEEFGSTGSTVCVEVNVSDFTDILSFQYTIQWDPAVLQLPTPISGSVNNLGALTDIFFGPAVPTNSLTVSWSEPNFLGESLADGTGIFEICFEVIGAAGSSSPITFSGNLTPVEVLNSGFEAVGFNGVAGSVTVAGNMTLTFTSCSSPSGGTNVGTFTLTASGGTPPYTYSWVNTTNAAIFGSGSILVNGGSDTAGDNMPAADTPLPPGTYDVTLTDASGAIQMASVEIFDAPQLLVFINGTPPTCSNLTNGSMEITSLPLGGIAPHNIVWSNAATGVTMIDNLAQGAYSVTVTDAAGCSAFAQNGLQTSQITVDTLVLQHVSCNGPGNDGQITIAGMGGTVGPGNDYGYAWDNGGIGPTITNLTPGQYCVSVTDDNSCEIIHCIDINAPNPPIVVSWDSVSVSCPTDMNGSLTINVTPGNAPIDSYTWDPIQPGADETITGIGPGTYFVTVTAVDGCELIDSASLFAPMALTFDSSQTVSPSCPGDNNGSITVFVSGGTGPFTYNWNTGAVSNFPLLPALVGDSTYTVTITDSGNCGDTIVEQIFLPNPPPIEVAFINLAPVSCDGGVPCDGQATAIASGGTAGTGLYNYNWPSGESELGVIQSTAMQLCQGPMTLEVNDGQCSVTIDTIIASPPPLTVDIDNTMSAPASCFNEDDGGATVQGAGGTPGYTYQWTNPMVTGPTISDVTAGNYNVVITDANGCTFPFVIEVGQPDSLIATISGQMDASCADGDDGMLEVTWIGGNPGNATYSWTSQVSTASTANNLAAGVYTVTVTDQNGCVDIATGVVGQPDPIFFELDTIIEPACFGFQGFIIVDTAYGGSGMINSDYQASIGGGNFAIGAGIPVLAGSYDLTVTDNSQCTSSMPITVNQPPPLVVDFGTDIEEIELGDSIELDPTISSFVAIDSIIWDPLTALACLDSACTEVIVQPLENTVYNVTVIDTSGCVGSDNILIEVDKNRNVYIPNIFTPDGDGLNDIFTVFTGTGVERILTLQVFDRWGEQVYNAPEPFVPMDFLNPGWDGTFKGRTMNPAVFIYLIEVEFSDGVVLLYRGDVTLMW